MLQTRGTQSPPWSVTLRSPIVPSAGHSLRLNPQTVTSVHCFPFVDVYFLPEVVLTVLQDRSSKPSCDLLLFGRRLCFLASFSWVFPPVLGVSGASSYVALPPLPYCTNRQNSWWVDFVLSPFFESFQLLWWWFLASKTWSLGRSNRSRKNSGVNRLVQHWFGCDF